MKKTLTLFAALLCAATMAKAETTEMTSTDQAYLESKNALVAAPAADAEKDAKYWAEAVASRVKVMGYAQGGYTAKFNAANHEANTNTFDMKRVILMVGVDITKDFYAFFMHDFKSGTMQEYYMEYRPMKQLNFRFGQSKKEITMENPMSPTVLESIGPMSQGVFWLCGADPLIANGSGRDIGLTVYGDLFNNKLRYVLEVLNGGQINTTDRNTQKDIIAKLEYKPIPNLRFSVSGQKGYGQALDAAFKKVGQDADGNDIYVPAAGNLNHDVKRGERYVSDRWAFGAEWKSKKTGTDYNNNRCVTVRSEVLGGRDGNCHSYGAYISSAVPVYKRLDVVGMVDFFNKNTECDFKQTNVMGGVQYWIHKKCRLQAQYTYSFKSSNLKAVDNAGNYGQFQTQVQVAF